MNRGVKQAIYFDILTENKTVTVPGDFPNLQAAIDAYQRTFIPRDVRLTIKVAAGFQNSTVAYDLTHPFGDQITIEGAEPTVSSTLTGLVWAAQGNKQFAFTVPNASALFAVGDVVLIKNVVGTGRYPQFQGVYRVAAVSGTQLQVYSGHNSMSAFSSGTTVTGGSITKFATVFRFTGCMGFVGRNGQIPRLQNIALVGDGTTSDATRHGLSLVGATTNISGAFGVTDFAGTGFYLSLDSWVKATGEEDIIASCNNGVDGFGTFYGSYLYVSAIFASGNGRFGYQSDRGDGSEIAKFICCGNGNSGLSAATTSVAITSSHIGNNVGNGVVARHNAYIIFQSGISYSNGTIDYYAYYLAQITITTMVTWIIASVLSPAKNTLNSNGGYIQTA